MTLMAESVLNSSAACPCRVTETLQENMLECSGEWAVGLLQGVRHEEMGEGAAAPTLGAVLVQLEGAVQARMCWALPL